MMGRIDSANVFRDGRALWPSGYVLRLRPDGAWELLSAEFSKPVVTLASGKAQIDPQGWHHLELGFQGTRIVACLDGSRIASVENAAHARGMFALGTEWNHVEFDNLQVNGFASSCR